jgi:ferredoxin
MLGYNRYILSGGDAADFLEEMAVAWGAPYKLAYDCADCGLCESACTQHLPIRERLAHINALYAARPSPKKEALDRCFAPGKAGKRTGVYAVGTDALAMLRHYEEVYGTPDFPLFLFDSDPQKWGLEPAWPGFPVRPPAEVEELGIERLVIASRAYHAEIAASLAPLEKKGLELVRYDPFPEATV